MRKSLIFMALAVCLSASLWSAAAQNRPQPPNVKTSSPVYEPIVPEEIIRQFTTKESELREIWKEYSYQQESKLQVLGPADTISGEFYQVSEFVFNDAGKRLERILRAPPSTLDRAGLTMTQEDRDAFVNLQPFALAKEDLPNYLVSYVGKEKIDELNTYVFDVIPKVMSNQRELERMRKQELEGKFFQGRIWVDDQDLQIVKTAGKTVPEFKQRFPKFETYRENIDDRFWFPTYTFGDDVLSFPKGGNVHVRMVVKYKNYRRFQSDIKFLDTEEIKGAPKPGEPNKPGEGNPGEVKKEETKKTDAKKEDPKAKPQRPRP